jgi:predicted lipopolysaccharide heptosyltransferase III
VSVLLVRLRLIGDVVFTTPLIRALRERYPDARLTYVVEPSSAPVVARNPHLSDVVIAPHRRGWRRLADDIGLARTLRARRYDVAIDLHGGPRSAWLTWASGAPVRVGYDVSGRSWMYTRVIHRPRQLRPRHSVENQWDLLAAVDEAFAAPAERDRHRVEMAVDPGARAQVRARLQSAGAPADAQLVVIHVSAGNPFRRWPEPAFAALVSSLAAEHARRWIVVTSGPSDHEAAARVITDARSRAPEAASRIVEVDGLSLTGLRALMDEAALFIGGDSGPLHIAATSDVPIVGLYGPTLAERSAPWRPRTLPAEAVDAGALPCRPCEQRTCVPGDFRCLTSIPAEAVRDAARRLLGAVS